jgi:hypothetical protein
MNQNEAVNTNRENTQSRPTVDSPPPVNAATHAGRRPGPQTADAKAKVRHNAVRHGLCTIVPVIPRLERAADWEAHRTGVLESLQPVGYLETLWAERVILGFWRLRRLAAYELAQITEESTYGELSLPDEMDRIVRYEAHFGRQLCQAMHELEALQKQRRGEAAPLARVDVHGLPGT